MRYNPPTAVERLLHTTSLLAAVFPLLVALTLIGWLALASDSDPALHALGALPPPSDDSVFPAMWHSLLLASLTMTLAVPLGIGTAIYLSELSGPSRVADILETAVLNLAGVPSVLYGLAGLVMFSDGLGSAPTMWAAALTLGSLALPIIVLASLRALRSVPNGVREAALGLGASPWDATRIVVLPIAMPGIITGVVLALGRVLGEAAALLVLVGAVATADRSDVALPVRIYAWLSSGDPALVFRTGLAVAVLLSGMLFVNGFASALRGQFRELR